MKALSILAESFRLYADSSAHRNHHPVFLPETDGGWSALVCPYVRLSRLGMNISQRFASRYYDSIGAACIFVPTRTKDSMAKLDERYFAMDSAFTAGECIPQTIDFNIKAFGKESTCSTQTLEVDKIIATLSTFMTFRMGDMLIFPEFALSTPVNEGDHVTALINEHPSLDIKIK